MSSPAEKLVKMANQIARNLAARGEQRAIMATADHIAKFWNPRMRSGIAGHLAAGGEGLDPIARAAIDRLQTPSKID